MTFSPQDRWVLHIDMDAFFASVEQLTRPTLRGRPVLVGSMVVAGASYEARALGAHSAMPMHQAKKLVGFRAVTVTPRKAVYAAASKRVFDIIADHVGVIEQLSIDEAFMEPEALRGATAEEVTAWANTLRETIRRETGLPSSIGAGSGKQYAKIGSGLAKPDGMAVVRYADLVDLPVRKLWGVGPVAEQKLHAIGIETIGDFAAISQQTAEDTLGQAVGHSLWMLAKGHDDRPVQPRGQSKSIGAEHTYSKDIIDWVGMEAALLRAFKEAYRRLVKDGRACRTITVKLKLADFTVQSRSASLSYASVDEQVLYAQALALCRNPKEIGAVRLVGVSFSTLEHSTQEVMFPELDRRVTTSADFSGVFDADGGLSGSDGAGRPVRRWRATEDVYHPEFGHGWVQGSGHGVVSVRFETRTTERGRTRSFTVDDPQLRPADPLNSLEWPGIGDWEEQERFQERQEHE